MKKIIQVLLLTAAILAFAGWGKAEPNTGNQHTLRASATTATSATRSTAEAETDGKAGENEPEVPTEKEEIGETPTEDLPDTTAAPIETTSPPALQEPKESTPVTEPPKTDPPETEPVVTEPPKQTDPPAESPKQTEPPTEPPVATEPPRPTPPPATDQPTEPPR